MLALMLMVTAFGVSSAWAARMVKGHRHRGNGAIATAVWRDMQNDSHERWGQY